MGERDFDEPVVSTSGICDQAGSVVTAYGIVCALLARERLGIAQRINTSLLGSSILLNGYGINVSLLRGFAIAKHTRKRSRNPFSNYYRCRDGKWIMLCELQSDRFWDEFHRVLGLPKDDARFANSLKRRENCVELVKMLDTIFATKTKDEWLKEFERNGVGFAYSLIYDAIEVGADQDALLNNYIIEMDHPAFGQCKMVGFPVGFDETPARVQRVAPEIGQHTEEVLMDILGYAWDDIESLRRDRVI